MRRNSICFSVPLLSAMALIALSCSEPKPAANDPAVAASIARAVQQGAVTFTNESITMPLISGETYTIELVQTDGSGRYLPISAVMKMASGAPLSSNVPPVPPPETKLPIALVDSLSDVKRHARTGVVVGRLTTSGISGAEGPIPQGTYTVILTTNRGDPVAVLIDAKGKAVTSSTNLFTSD